MTEIKYRLMTNNELENNDKFKKCDVKQEWTLLFAGDFGAKITYSEAGKSVLNMIESTHANCQLVKLDCFNVRLINNAFIKELDND